MRRLFHGLARSGRIERQTFPGLYESFSTLTVHIDCQSTATVDLHTANGRALNEGDAVSYAVRRTGSEGGR